jgi:hypothetical protein
MCVFAEVDFVLPEVAKYRLFGQAMATGTSFRRWFAKVADQQKLDVPSAVFNYGLGRSLSTLPPIRFAAYPAGVRLIGVGETGIELLQAIAPSVQMALAKGSQALVGVNVRNGQNRLESSHPIAYWVNTLAFGQHHAAKQWRAWQAEAGTPSALIEHPKAAPRLRDLLLRQLARQLVECHFRSVDDVLGDDFSDVVAAITDAETPQSAADAASLILARRLDLKLVAADRFLTVPSGGTLNRLHAEASGYGPGGTLALGGVAIELRAKLTGSWSVGLLQARGLGIVHRRRESGA